MQQQQVQRRRIVAFDVGRGCTGVAVVDVDDGARNILEVVHLACITSDIPNDRSKGIVKRKKDEFLARLVAPGGIDTIMSSFPADRVHVLYEHAVAINGGNVGCNFVVDGINALIHDRCIERGYHVMRVQPMEKRGVFDGLTHADLRAQKHKDRSVELALEHFAEKGLDAALETVQTFPRKHDVADAINMVLHVITNETKRRQVINRESSSKHNAAAFAIAAKYWKRKQAPKVPKVTTPKARKVPKATTPKAPSKKSYPKVKREPMK
jgi:hypothetical protein